MVAPDVNLGVFAAFSSVSGKDGRFALGGSGDVRVRALVGVCKSLAAMVEGDDGVIVEAFQNVSVRCSNSDIL